MRVGRYLLPSCWPSLGHTALHSQEHLTATHGALWHVVVCKGGDVAVAVSAEPGTFMDVRVRGYRVSAWKHSLEVSMRG